MNSAENSKLSRVISTKVTHEEANFLMKIATQYKSQGYIPKATPSEICRFILRVYMRYLISHKSDPMARDTKTTQSNASMQTNPPIIAFKEISPSSRHRTEDISQRVSHGDSISRNNISSIGSAQQSDSVHGNNKYVDQIPTGSINTRNQTRDTSSRMNYVSQPANIFRPSQVEKNLNDIWWPPSLEYVKYLRQLGLRYAILDT